MTLILHIFWVGTIFTNRLIKNLKSMFNKKIKAMSIIRYNPNDFMPSTFSSMVDRFFNESLARSGGSTFTPKVSGDYNIIVRATDKTGKAQSIDFADPFPNGASGYDMVSIKV